MKKLITKIKRLIRYVPVLWRSYDWDYHYAIELFKMKLEDIATFLESDKAFSLNAKQDAQRIRTALRLMDKVYAEDYLMSYKDKVEEKYGRMTLEFTPYEKDDRLHQVKTYYGGVPETPEIKAMLRAELKRAQDLQDKAHRVLWKMIEYNIEKWWD